MIVTQASSAFRRTVQLSEGGDIVQVCDLLTEVNPVTLEVRKYYLCDIEQNYVTYLRDCRQCNIPGCAWEKRLK